MGAMGWVAAAIIAVILYALYLGRHVKIGVKIPLASFFFESEDHGPQEEVKLASTEIGHKPLK